MAKMTATQTLFCLKNLPVRQSILIAGDHGRGKSEVVAQATREMGGQLIDIRLSQCDTGDVKGMPFHINGRTFFAPPNWFPIKDEDATMIQKLLGLAQAVASGQFGPVGTLFFDELNRATREVQQAVFEIILDRRLNMISIPDGWRVVAAINDNSSIYTVNDMEPALVSRFFIIHFNPSIDEWLTWADSNNVHESVIQFIRKIPDLLDPTEQLLKEASLREGVEKLHDRRSWVRFSKAIQDLIAKHEKGEIDKHPLSKDQDALDLLMLMGDGFVGNMAAVKFADFIRTDYQSLDANVILNKWDASIAKRVQAVVNEGRIPEMGSYNEDLVAYIVKHVNKALSAKQGENLLHYLEMLPKEIVSDFWVSLNNENSTVAEQWYRADKKHTQVIVQAIMNKTKKN